MSSDGKGQLDDSLNDKERVNRGKDRYGHHFSDMSDNIGTQRPTATAKGHVIHWHSVATGATVHFKAFLTDFKDRYESTWNDQETFGRMDPISTFKRTGRVITLSWDVPAASVEEARFNLREAERFISMLYPTYEELNTASSSTEDAGIDRANQAYLDTLEAGDTATGTAENNALAAEKRVQQEILAGKRGGIKRKVGVMVAAPLFKLKFANLIMDNRDGASIRGGAASSGLTGKLSGLTYEPDIEQGFFGHSGIDGVAEGVLIPQTIKFSCEFTVLHTSPLGWNRKLRLSDRKRSRGFPYHSGDVTKSRRK